MSPSQATALHPAPLIRSLDPLQDLGAVEDLFTRAADYWLLAEGYAPDRRKAEGFFADCPPGSDISRSQHLGVFSGAVLIGVAELSFGFPQAPDAYLGLMILDPAWRGQGAGRLLLAQVESLARNAGAARLYLGVLEVNPRGQAFWQRQGFEPTGVSRVDADTGRRLFRLGKDL